MGTYLKKNPSQERAGEMTQGRPLVQTPVLKKKKKKSLEG
jgi:hypothetical protein